MSTLTEAPIQKPGIKFVLAIVFLDMMGIGLAIPVGPHVIAGFLGGDFSRAALYVGAIGALYTGMMFCFAPLLGALSDRFGRKPVLLVALAASTCSYVASALAPTVGLFLLARGLAGFGGASITVAQTYVADVSSAEDRAKNYGLMGAMFGFGFIIGPALGGLLGNYGVRMPFWAAGAAMLCSFLYCAFVLPESHDVAHRRAFTWLEANPLGWIVTLRRHPVVLGFALAMLWLWAGQQCLQNTWVVFTAYRFHWSPAQNGMSLALVGITSVIVQGGLIGLLVRKLGERTAIIGGLLWTALGLLGYGLANEAWMMYVIIAASSLGGIAMPTLQGVVSKQVGPSEQGSVQGALTSLTSLTGIAGPVIANGLFAHFTAADATVKIPGAAFLLGSALTVVGTLMIWPLLGRVFQPAEAV